MRNSIGSSPFLLLLLVIVIISGNTLKDTTDNEILFDPYHYELASKNAFNDIIFRLETFVPSMYSNPAFFNFNFLVGDY